MKLAALLFALPLFATSAMASDFQQMTLKSDSVVCFDSDDWDEMIAASVDQDVAAVKRLVNSGACRVITSPTRVSYLDPAAGGRGALIQMPSGKTGYTADEFLQQ
ncbi:hypothetical protein [Pseudomonas sp. BN606]|jgi:hypothetical protein|uniref:hypothetical protein n=1 Tax=Pseudomonas sp. BN606 TaxID=2567894 RepID=UPI0024538D7F|nr:hypothetical protein [Pseudomonas sp. BN606]MDH4651703.1 hypothetical protein [Pseudomonas sp. BN606]